MKPCFDLTGHQFGRWIVIGQVDAPEHLRSNRHKAFWKCKCKCGYESVVLGQNLRNGKSKSCGCGTLKQAED